MDLKWILKGLINGGSHFDHNGEIHIGQRECHVWYCFYTNIYTINIYEFADVLQVFQQRLNPQKIIQLTSLQGEPENNRKQDIHASS